MRYKTSNNWEFICACCGRTFFVKADENEEDFSGLIPTRLHEQICDSCLEADDEVKTSKRNRKDDW
jgi:hypothetical protein